MNQTIERTALTHLVTNEEFARKVLPHIKSDYFSDRTERTIFEEIEKFVDKYKKIPTQTHVLRGRTQAAQPRCKLPEMYQKRTKRAISVVK